MVTNGSGHGQTPRPDPVRPHRLAIYCALTHLGSSSLAPLPLSLVIIKSVRVADLQVSTQGLLATMAKQRCTDSG